MLFVRGAVGEKDSGVFCWGKAVRGSSLFNSGFISMVVSRRLI